MCQHQLQLVFSGVLVPAVILELKKENVFGVLGYLEDKEESTSSSK
jgi:hypothetical protein